MAAAVAGHLDATLHGLVRIRDSVRALLETVEQAGRRPAREDLRSIRDDLQSCLLEEDHPMDGIGVAAAVGYLADSAYWLEWWRHDTRGGLEFVAHSLNPQRDTFYDYSARSWFSVPAATGVPTVTGPYVDIGGTNAYTVTVSLPVSTAGGFAGIAGADIAAARFERFLLPARPEHSPLVLTNADWRVVASNSSQYLPGDILREHSAGIDVDVASDVFPAGKAWRLYSPA